MTYIPDDATEAETAELAAEQRELARIKRERAESDARFSVLLAEWRGAAV